MARMAANDTDTATIQNGGYGVRLRPAVASDIGFITKSWLRSAAATPPFRHMVHELYYKIHHRLLEQLIPRSMTLVMYPEGGDPDHIVGFLCYEVLDTALLLHYCYVKQPYRNLGICRAVLQTILETEQPPVVFFTHLPKRMEIRDHVPQTWLYCPHHAFLRLDSDWHRANHG